MPVVGGEFVGDAREPVLRGRAGRLPHGQPADLFYRVRAHDTAQGLGDQLAAQAVTEDGQAASVGGPDQFQFPADPVQVVVYGHGAAHEDQGGYAVQIRFRGHALVHGDQFSSEALFPEYVFQESRAFAGHMAKDTNGFHEILFLLLVRKVVVSQFSPMSTLTDTSAWRLLREHFRDIEPLHMRDWFEADPDRLSRFSLRLGDLMLDYSKNRITDETMALLMELARQRDLPAWIERMFRGGKINNTEHRAVLHVALRNRDNRPVRVDGKDVMPAVNAVLAKMRAFVSRVRGGQWTGFTGKPILDVVNIGIGGSHLGPEMAVKALHPYTGIPRLHFVSNVDGSDIADVLADLDPEQTLFIVASKSFTTRETLTNAHTARDWLLNRAGDRRHVADHFVACSVNAQAVQDFGIGAENRFEFWDWVGGRYSLWSAIGLPIALAVGMDRFEQMLKGAHAMDRHFREAPLEENMPVILGLLGVWYVNFFQAASIAVLPYSRHLRRFPAYLQQCDMESNGKRVTRDGEPIDYPTAPVLWGEPGTNGQHAFLQWIHQGTQLAPVDFIAAIHPPHDHVAHHEQLLANGFAQAEALMRGRTERETRALQNADEDEALIPHKTFPGNRPSNTLLFDKLTPYALGRLIALYEHKVFVQAVIWGLNAYDQWGVELGKELARDILKDVSDPEREIRLPLLRHYLGLE